MHRHTPTLAVIDPRGAAVRAVAYCRSSGMDDLQVHISQTVHDLQCRASHTRDPRLFALFQKDDSTPANQTTITSLSGASLLSVNVDAGWRLSLTGASGQPLESWDQKLNRRRVQYDAWLRPAFVFDLEAGAQERRSECLGYADASDDSARHNRCGQLVRHDDTAGSAYHSEFSLSGAPIEQARRFLKALNEPDWPQDQTGRDALLESESAVTRMGYNASGELIHHVDAQGNEQLLRQTLAGELSEVCLKSVSAASYTTLVGDIHYNAFGQIEQQTAGNNVVTYSTFDPANGRLNTLLAQVEGEPPLQDLAYAYDPVGNLTTITDNAQPIRHLRNQRVVPLNTYRYNTLYRLIEACGRQRISAPYGPQLPEFISPPDSTQLENYRQTFEYDGGGNLHTLNHFAESGSRCERTAMAATSNRSLPYTAAGDRPDEGEIARRYDVNGNLTLLQEGQNLLWSGRNQLRKVDQVVRKDGPNDSECYIYDSAGKRLRKVRTAQSSGLTRTHETRYLPGLEIRTTPEQTLHVISVQAGRCTVQILHWEKGRPSHIAADQHRYILTDHLGSSSLELDVAARLISQESYYAYGGTAWWAGRDKVEASYRTVRYSGQERDQTGFCYYGFRYYLPWRQRWLSTDPGGTHDGLNLYGMVGGNPVGYVDLQGLTKTRVNWSERAKAIPAGIIRGGIKGSMGYGAKRLAKLALNATLGQMARVPLAIMTGAGVAYAAAGLTANVTKQLDLTGNSRNLLTGAAGIAGFGVGFANGYLNPDPIGAMSDIAKDLGSALTGRGIASLGPAITYDANATLASQAIDIGANLGVNFVEGMWLGPLTDSVVKPLRAAANGAIKSLVGDVVRSTDAVPASYRESRHSELLAMPSLEDGKQMAQTFMHDSAMSTIYSFGNDLLNLGMDAALGGTQVDPTLRAGFENLQIVNEAEAVLGEAVLSGWRLDDVNAVPSVTTTRTSTAANLQAAADKNTARNLRRSGYSTAANNELATWV